MTAVLNGRTAVIDALIKRNAAVNNPDSVHKILSLYFAGFAMSAVCNAQSDRCHVCLYFSVETPHCTMLPSTLYIIE